MSQKANTSIDSNKHQFKQDWQAIVPGTVQNVSYTGTAGQSAAFQNSTTIVRVVATSDCYVLKGTNPTATSSNGSYLPLGVVEYFGVNPGEKISVVQSTATGSLNITEGA